MRCALVVAGLFLRWGGFFRRCLFRPVVLDLRFGSTCLLGSVAETKPYAPVCDDFTDWAMAPMLKSLIKISKPVVTLVLAGEIRKLLY